MEADDIALIARVLASDDRRAFGELVQRHQAPLRAFLTRLTRGDHAQADDLAQETFIQAYRSLGRFRGGSQFRTWLLGIAYNQFRSAARRQTATEALEEVAEAQAAVPRPPATSASDLHQDLAAAVATLSPEQQTVVHLCYREGLSHAEASCVLEWPLGSVKTHLLRAKQHLRERLSAWAPG